MTGASRDTLFASGRRQLSDFAFDQNVVDVFPDMLRRSIPGYENTIAMLGVFARRHMQPDSNVYDLGCSLGAATLALYQQQPCNPIHYIGVDNSQAMLDQCRLHVDKHMPNADITLFCEDIQNTEIKNASVIVLNFTLQFLPPESRQALVDKLHTGLNTGGALIISEKIEFPSLEHQHLFTEIYHDFKRANLYSDMEISQKRTALENVLITDTPEQHLERLHNSGFKQAYQWQQNLNFASFVAIK